MGGTGMGAITVRVEVSSGDGSQEETTLEAKTWLFRPALPKVERCDDERCVWTARKYDLASTTRLFVATAFCLIWNVASTVVTLALVREGLRSNVSIDSPEMVTLVLTAMPFLIVGSVLMWLVVAEWSKRLGKGYAGGNFCRCLDSDSTRLQGISAWESDLVGVQLT